MPCDDLDWLHDPARRAYLLRLLVGGALAAAPAGSARAFWFGSSSNKLADGQSVFTLKGDVTVNGQPADKSTRIQAGDRVRTGADSDIVFAVGGDSFILRDNSELELGGAGFLLASLRILSGRLLSVFARREAGQRLRLTASTATIGVRGTGMYIEAAADVTYLCTCYGQVELSANADPGDSESISTTNHDKPRYIYATPRNGSRIRSAPVINHSNEELELLESLVGRKAPNLRKSYQK